MPQKLGPQLWSCRHGMNSWRPGIPQKPQSKTKVIFHTLKSKYIKEVFEWQLTIDVIIWKWLKPHVVQLHDVLLVVLRIITINLHHNYNSHMLHYIISLNLSINQATAPIPCRSGNDRLKLSFLVMFHKSLHKNVFSSSINSSNVNQSFIQMNFKPRATIKQ